MLYLGSTKIFICTNYIVKPLTYPKHLTPVQPWACLHKPKFHLKVSRLMGKILQQTENHIGRSICRQLEKPTTPQFHPKATGEVTANLDMDKQQFHLKVWERYNKAPFGLPHIQLVRFIFSARTVFFSHNSSARTVFFSQFQLRFSKPNGASRLLLESAR